MFEALKALLFGIVEGITEWLPISSTGHMMLLNQFVTLDVSDAFYDTFLVTIQLGAIMAVIILYFHKLNPFSPSKTADEKRTTWGIWGKVVVGSIPPAIIGLLLDDWLEEHIMNNPNIAYIVVSAALIVYGIIFIVLEARNRQLIEQAKRMAARRASRGRHARGDEPARTTRTGSSSATRSAGAMANAAAVAANGDESSLIAQVNSFEELSFGRAFLIGIFESLAVIPGTSRSGSIIIGSMLLGCSRTIAAEFAFFLAIPIMFGWSLVKFIKHGFAYTGLEWMIFAVGIITAFLVSVAAIKFLMGYIKKNDFTAFGIYRIILAIVVLGYFGSRALLGW